MVNRWIWVSILSVVTACGSRTNPRPPDLRMLADLTTPASADLFIPVVPDQAGVVCSAVADHGALGVGTGQGSSDTGTSGEAMVFWDGLLNNDTNPDAIAVELYGGAGVFASNPQLKTGIFELTGDELNYATCGLCVLLYTDLMDVSGTTRPTDFYMATGGTVTLTSVNGNIKGSLSNVTFEHVTIDNATFQSSATSPSSTSPSTTRPSSRRPWATGATRRSRR
jgi:hypothetical protein